jgi:hypothetical protein
VGLFARGSLALAPGFVPFVCPLSVAVAVAPCFDAVPAMSFAAVPTAHTFAAAGLCGARLFAPGGIAGATTRRTARFMASCAVPVSRDRALFAICGGRFAALSLRLFVISLALHLSVIPPIPFFTP